MKADFDFKAIHRVPFAEGDECSFQLTICINYDWFAIHRLPLDCSSLPERTCLWIINEGIFLGMWLFGRGDNEDGKNLRNVSKLEVSAVLKIALKSLCCAPFESFRHVPVSNDAAWKWMFACELVHGRFGLEPRVWQWGVPSTVPLPPRQYPSSTSSRVYFYPLVWQVVS